MTKYIHLSSIQIIARFINIVNHEDTSSSVRQALQVSLSGLTESDLWFQYYGDTKFGMMHAPG